MNSEYIKNLIEAIRISDKTIEYLLVNPDDFNEHLKMEMNARATIPCPSSDPIKCRLYGVEIVTSHYIKRGEFAISCK